MTGRTMPGQDSPHATRTGRDIQACAPTPSLMAAWLAENLVALDAWHDDFERNGLPLAAHRQF